MDNDGNFVINKSTPHKWADVAHYEEEYSLVEEHENLLSILLVFDGFCREHSIFYSIADGTLLGAMRHGDFIPWDDDADVMLTKPEYIKLKEALTLDSPIKLFKISFLDRISTPEMLKKEIFIDLFINEDMPKNKLVFGWKKLATAFLRSSFRGMPENYRYRKLSKRERMFRRIAGSISCTLSRLLIGKRSVFDLNERVVAIGMRKPSGIYTRYTSRMYETKRRFNKDSYETGYGNVSFRGHTLMAIKNADTFLSEMYGDYSAMPPEENRKPEHPINMLDAADECICRYN